jgi:diguanylate cyclase (GGDEF)-like protein
MEEHPLNTASLRLAQGGGTGSLRETWPDGKVYLTGYSQTGQVGNGASLQWSVLVRQPEMVALAASHKLERLILWLSVALAAALALATALLARRLTRPLNSLSSVVEQRARAGAIDGALPPIPVIGTFHEAQVLSQAMREMVLGEERHVHLLQTMNEQLESTVAARTAELQKLVMRDALTGLLNRRALMQALPEAMRRSVRLQKPCAVMFLDLDGFKKINDTHGHEEGDELLRQFGQRIVHAVRGTDTVARLAGDEFVVILENLAAPNDAEAMGRKIMPRLREPFYLKAATVSLSASIGVAVHVAEAGEDLDALLARADRAMYQAKRQGKNNVVMAPALD